VPEEPPTVGVHDAFGQLRELEEEEEEEEVPGLAELARVVQSLR
jgi:hypothetical protein